MLLAPFLQHARQSPDQLLFSDEHTRLTRAQALAQAAALSMLLRSRTTRSTVGLLLPTSVAFAVSFYGTLLSGKTAVPINFLLGEREIGHILADSGMDTILSAPPLAGKLAGSGLQVIDLSALTGAAPSAPPGFEPPESSGSDLASLLYTSGTSGLPKGVMLSHGNLSSDVKAAAEHFGLTGDHRFLGIVPLFHSTGLLATLIAPVEVGASAYYIPRFSPVATLQAIRQEAISVMAAVPSMYGALLRLKDASSQDFAGVEIAISGGEPLPANIRAAMLQRYNVRLMEGYGLTETCGPFCANTPDAYREGSVGRPLPGASVRVVDDSGNEVARGQTGELLLRGPMIMRGYHNNPSATAEVMTSEGFFRSGDLGHVDADGFIFITGRKKDMIIVSGEKVYPREVEELLMTHPAVAEAAVVGKKDASRGEVVAAYLIARPEAELDGDQVREYCREKGLMGWKIPREIRIVEDFPRTPTGKVLKRELAARLEAETA